MVNLSTKFMEKYVKAESSVSICLMIFFEKIFETADRESIIPYHPAVAAEN